MTRLPAVTVALLLLVFTAAAQEVSPPVAAQAVTPPAPLKPSELMSDRLAQLALRLGTGVGTQKLRPDQLRRSLLLLERALALEPQDAGLERLRREALEALGEASKVTESLRRYCDLEPQDDAAQLALILRLLEPMQTAQERLEAMRRMIAERQGQQLSPAVRSRLSSRAAEILLETEDRAGAAQAVRTALILDPSNKHAGALRLQMVREAGGSPQEVGLALLGMLRCDPLDAQTHLALSRLLLAHGHYSLAWQQFTVASRTGNPDAEVYLEWACAAAGAGDFAASLALLEQWERTLLAARPAEPPVTPQDLLLPPPAELLRMLLFEALGDSAKADGSFGRLSLAFQKLAQEQGPNSDAALHLAWIRALAGREVQAASRAMASMPDRFEDSPRRTPEQAAANDKLVRVRGYLALQRGEPEAARLLLESVAQRDVWSALGLALAQPPGDAQAVRQQLERTVDQAPTELGGVAAAIRLHLQDAAPKPRRTLGRVVAALETWPDNVVRPNAATGRWVSVVADAAPHSLGLLDRQVLSIDMRNLSGMHLALGEAGTLPTRALLFISASINANPFPKPLVQPVDLGRRLSLADSEGTTVEVDLHRSALALFLAENPHLTVDFSLRLLTDPRNTGVGEPVRGPLGATVWVNFLQRPGLPVSLQSVNAWMRDVFDPDPVQRMRTLTCLCWLMTRVPQDAQPAEQWSDIPARVAQTLEGLYPTLSALEQAWVWCFVEPGDKTRELLRGPYEAALRSDDPLLRLVLLERHTTLADEAQINAALRHPEALISTYAKLLREGLEAQAKAKAEAPPRPDTGPGTGPDLP